MTKRSKKNNVWKLVLFSLGGAVLIMLGLAGYDWWTERRAHFIRYAAFGIDIPVNYSIHGIDVSKYQNIIDWGSVKDMKVGDVQLSFAFIKATEGLGNEDACFQRNWKKAKDAGLARGAYVLTDAPSGKPNVILIASGSEVGLCLAARETLIADGVAVRIVSMPSWELFE